MVKDIWHSSQIRYGMIRHIIKVDQGPEYRAKVNDKRKANFKRLDDDKRFLSKNDVRMMENLHLADTWSAWRHTLKT